MRERPCEQMRSTHFLPSAEWSSPSGKVERHCVQDPTERHRRERVLTQLSTQKPTGVNSIFLLVLSRLEGQRSETFPSGPNLQQQSLFWFTTLSQVKWAWAKKVEEKKEDSKRTSWGVITNAALQTTTVKVIWYFKGIWPYLFNFSFQFLIYSLLVFDYFTLPSRIYWVKGKNTTRTGRRTRTVHSQHPNELEISSLQRTRSFGLGKETRENPHWHEENVQHLQGKIPARTESRPLLPC